MLSPLMSCSEDARSSPPKSETWLQSRQLSDRRLAGTWLSMSCGILRFFLRSNPKLFHRRNSFVGPARKCETRYFATSNYKQSVFSETVIAGWIDINILRIDTVCIRLN